MDAELIARVRHALAANDGQEMQVSPIEAHILAIYSRARSLFEGACALVRERLPEEAAILCRELYTASLHLMELADREADRPSLVLSMLTRTLTEREHLARQATAFGVADGRHEEAVKADVAEQRRRIALYRERHSMTGKLRRFSAEQDLARQFGLLDEYLDFEVANNMVHQHDFAQAGRIVRIEGGAAIALLNERSDFGDAALCFAMTSALRACKAASSIFRWHEPLPGIIDQLLREVEEAIPND